MFDLRNVYHRREKVFLKFKFYFWLYSSINPVENEAVLSRLIQQSQGALELVDCRGRLPGKISKNLFFGILKKMFMLCLVLCNI
jgi:hypothetical protein